MIPNCLLNFIYWKTLISAMLVFCSVLFPLSGIKYQKDYSLSWKTDSTKQSLVLWVFCLDWFFFHLFVFFLFQNKLHKQYSSTVNYFLQNRGAILKTFDFYVYIYIYYRQLNCLGLKRKQLLLSLGLLQLRRQKKHCRIFLRQVLPKGFPCLCTSSCM